MIATKRRSPTYPYSASTPNQLLWTVVQDFQEDVSYGGQEKIFAAYAMTDLPVTQKLSLTAGARLEDTDITIEPAGSLVIVVEMDGARTTRPAGTRGPATSAVGSSNSAIRP